MIGRALRPLIAVSVLPVLLATSAGASITTTTIATTTTTTPDGNAIIAASFALASQKTSVTISGTLTGSGTTLSLFGKYTSKASSGVTTVKGVGTSDEVQPNGARYGYVKATSIAALGRLLEIANPKSSEVNVWYKVTSKDSRFADFFGGASTVAQTFSFSPIGWTRTANYEGTSVVRGVSVYALVALSHLFIDKNGYNETTLYVTDSAVPLPLAMTGPIGTTGLIYFSKWNATRLTIPKTTKALPH
jgi:hypothetical protein